MIQPLASRSRCRKMLSDWSLFQKSCLPYSEGEVPVCRCLTASDNEPISNVDPECCRMCLEQLRDFSVWPKYERYRIRCDINLLFFYLSIYIGTKYVYVEMND